MIILPFGITKVSWYVIVVVMELKYGKNHFKVLEKTSANIVTTIKPNSTSDCIYMTVYGNYDTIYNNFNYLCRTHVTF